MNGAARNLYILRGDKNPVDDRILVELGNFGNEADLWRIRKPEIRQEYAYLIASALAR